MAASRKKRLVRAPKVKTANIPGRKGAVAAKPSFPFLALRSDLSGALFLLGALALVIGGYFSLPNYHVRFTEGSLADHLFVHPEMLLAGFGVFWWLFRFMPQVPERSEVPRSQAGLWLGFFSLLCFASRFYHPEEPAPYFWADQHVITADIRNIIDFGDHPLIFPLSSRMPLFPYFTAGLWELFPNASGVWIFRLASTFLDIGILWSLYFLGKEIGSKRTGLILASFWALSMAGIIWTYCGYGSNTVVLFCALALLAFFRTIRKPSLDRFIVLAVVLALADYTNIYFRPFIITLITLTLVWILYESGEKPKLSPPWILSAGLWVSWVFLFFKSNGFLPNDPFVSLFTHPLFLIPWLGALGMIYWKTSQEAGEFNRRIVGWATGALVTAFLLLPLMLNPYYASYGVTISSFHENGQLSMGLSALNSLWQNTVLCFNMLFHPFFRDFSGYPAFPHSFFELFPQTAMTIGLAYFLARPSWRKGFIVLMILVGVSPFILCHQAHTGRMFGAIPPFFLVAVLGLEAFWDHLVQGLKKPLLIGAAFILLLGFWAWDATWSVTVARQWMAHKTKNDCWIIQQADKDWRQYDLLVAEYGNDFGDTSFTVLCDQKDIAFLSNPNPIFLEPGQRGKDIVVLAYAGDAATEGRIRQEFPQAQWTNLASLNSDHFMQRILIPFESLDEDPKKLIYIQRVPHDYWRRRFYWACYPYGITRGVVKLDNRVGDLNTSFPRDMTQIPSVRADGEMTAPVTGHYVFAVVPTSNRVFLTIDGRSVKFHPPTAKEPLWAGGLDLDAGVHPVTYKVLFHDQYGFPDITVRPPGGAPGWILGKATGEAPKP